MTQTTDVRETVPVMSGADDTHRAERERLRRAEVALRDQIEAVAAMRRQLAPGPVVRDYVFLEGEKRVRLSELFAGGKRELVIYHVMYWADDDEFCPMCSMWIDGLDAIAPHLEQRINFAVATRAPFDKLQAWATQRGWRHARLLSDDGPDFARDTGAEDSNGDPVETVCVFTKDGSTIRNTYTAHAYVMGESRGIDLLAPAWHVFDLLPSGRSEDWNPSNDYMIKESS
jgi:predicted dithiol-disulfide oxidoreductase (DUF899 family)